MQVVMDDKKMGSYCEKTGGCARVGISLGAAAAFIVVGLGTLPWGKDSMENVSENIGPAFLKGAAAAVATAAVGGAILVARFCCLGALGIRRGCRAPEDNGSSQTSVRLSIVAADGNGGGVSYGAMDDCVNSAPGPKGSIH